MNITCCNQTTSSDLQQLLNQMRHLIENHIDLGVSFLGVLFNAFSLIVLMSASATSQLQHHFYKFLACRCFCSLVVCLTGIFSGVVLAWKLLETNYIRIFLFYYWHIPLRVVLFAAIISDNLLVLNRIVTLHDVKASIFYKLSKKANILICFAASAFLIVPIAVIVKISPDGKLDLSEFGGIFGSVTFHSHSLHTSFFQSLIAQACAIALVLIESVFPILTLGILNLVVLFKVKRILKRKKRNSKDRRRIDKANVRFTKLIIALTTISILTRFFESSVSFYIRLAGEFYPPAELAFLRQLGRLFLVVSHAFDGILYFHYDRQLRRVLRGIVYILRGRRYM